MRNSSLWRRPGLWILFLVVLYGCWLHAQLAIALPDPDIQPDSGGYLSAPLQYLYGGQPFHVPAIRGPGYPVFLLVVLSLFHELRAVVWFQHAMALLTAGISVRLFLLFAPRAYGWSALVFFITACSPRSIALSHAILADTFYTFLQMLSLGACLETIRRYSPWKAGLSGITAAWALQVRPVARSIFIGFVAGFWVYRRNRRWRLWLRPALASCFVTLALCGVWNKTTRGFWGAEKFGLYYVSGEAMRYVRLDHLQNADVRRVLTPYLSDGGADMRSRDIGWIWHSAEGPLGALRQDPQTAAHIEAAYSEIVKAALLSHPFYYVMTLVKAGRDFVIVGAQVPDNIRPKHVVVTESLHRYLLMTTPYPKARELLWAKPDFLATYLENLKHLETYPYMSPFVLPRQKLYWPVWPFAYTLVFLPTLGLASAALLMLRRRMRSFLVITMSIVLFQIGLVAIGGVYVFRYSLPLEPLYAIALGLAFTSGFQWISHLRKSSE